MKPSDVLSGLIPALSSRELNAEEIRGAAAALLDPGASDEARMSFLRAWTERGETAAELAACAEALLPQALDPGVRGSWNGKALLDCCGTGGGGLNLINISTGLMFILATLGIPVVKHGNRGLTKKSGSADVLEALGIRIDLPPGETQRCLEEVGCAFLFAPAYHLSFAAVAPVRKRLGAEGRRTIFNLLGPLLNPARPDARLVGVFKKAHTKLFADALQIMGCPKYSIAYGVDGRTRKPLGEASADSITVCEGTRFQGGLPLGSLKSTYREPQLDLESILVENAEESAQRLTALLTGDESGLGLEMLVTNAAVALMTIDQNLSLIDAQQKCREAIVSGDAYGCLKRWREFSHSR